MNIELLFTKRSNGFNDGCIIVGKFRTKKSAYQYVKDNRKSYCEGYFTLCIKKYNDYTFEVVRGQDLLNL